jgi:hypothetical protein
MTSKTDELNEKERAWVGAQLAAASQFVSVFSPSDAGQPLTLAALDRAFAAWMGSSPIDVNLVNQTINCVGIAFGSFLVDGIHLKWVIATDEHGSDLAVHGLPERGDVLLYPANFVAKRWERRTTNFLEDSYARIKQDVEDLARRPSKKPWWKLW